MGVARILRGEGVARTLRGAGRTQSSPRTRAAPPVCARAQSSPVSNPYGPYGFRGAVRTNPLRSVTSSDSSDFEVRVAGCPERSAAGFLTFLPHFRNSLFPALHLCMRSRMFGNAYSRLPHLSASLRIFGLARNPLFPAPHLYHAE